MVLDIRKLDIYRKVPKDLTQPTTAGAVISIICVVFIAFMIFNDILEYLSVEIRSELYVDDPGREGKIDVEVDVSFPFLKCEYLGVDIQDENGRHEVGFIDKTTKEPLPDNGCRFKSKFEINKVPGNFHLSTHSAERQPDNPDMRHIIHSIRFGDEIPNKDVKGSFNALKGKSTLKSEPLLTHEYILNIVPSIYEDMKGRVWNSYQYTFGHSDDCIITTVKAFFSLNIIYSCIVGSRLLWSLLFDGLFRKFFKRIFGFSDYLAYHHSGQVIPAVWFKYTVQPITVKHKEWRMSFYTFLTSVCAVVGGTFTVAGIIDSTFFTITDLVKKHQLGKLS